LENNKDILCPLPFVHPFFDVRGLYTACCNGAFYEDSKHVSELNSLEWFYSKEMETLRADMINGNRNRLCTHCWDKDDIGIRSPRFSHLYYWKNKIDINNPVPKYFDLKPDNTCNLACFFCTASSSDKIVRITEELNKTERPVRWDSSLHLVKEREKLGTFDDTVPDYILDNINNIEQLKFTGGEPFLIPKVLEILKKVSEIKPEVDIKITSNGTVITKDFYPVLDKLDNVKIKLSIDAIDELYDYIRFPSKWDQFQKRIENTFQSLPKVSFNINCLITSMNLEQIPKIIKWFKNIQNKNHNLEYIIIDPNITPKNNEASIHTMEKKYLQLIKDKIMHDTKDWDMTCKTNMQILNLFKKIDNAINLNFYDKKLLKLEYSRQNNIRNINIIDVVEPISKGYFKELLT